MTVDVYEHLRRQEVRENLSEESYLLIDLVSQNKMRFSQTVVVLHVNTFRASNYTLLGNQGCRIQLYHQILAVLLLNQDTMRAQISCNIELDRPWPR